MEIDRDIHTNYVNYLYMLAETWWRCETLTSCVVNVTVVWMCMYRNG